MTMNVVEMPSYTEVWIRKDPIAIVHAGGVGIKLGVVVEDQSGAARDLSSAISAAFVLTDPDGVRTSYPLTFADFGTATGDGTDGAMMLVIGTEDVLDQVGTWKAQVEVIASGGIRYSTDEVIFIVRSAANSSVLILPETLLSSLHLAWWRNLFTVGNPGRIQLWLDMWQGTGLDANSVSAAGGPAFNNSDPVFGGKVSYLYDESRDLEAGVAADWSVLHDGTGCTIWGDIQCNDAAEVDSIFGTAWVPTQRGVKFQYDGPNEELVLYIYNATANALHEVRSGVGSLPVGTRARFAIDWCYDDPSNADVRMYLNGALVYSADTVYPNAPASGAPQDEIHVGEDPSGTSARFTGKLAELGFIRQCRIAPEMSAYLMAQP